MPENEELAGDDLLVVKIADQLLGKGWAKIRVRKGKRTAAKGKELLERGAKVADVKVTISAKDGHSLAEVK